MFLSSIIIVTISVHVAFVSSANCGQTPVMPDFTLRNNAGGLGATIAVPYSWPWMADLCQINDDGSCSLGCGVTIVDNNWLITAAHCVDGDVSDNGHVIRFKVGAFDQTRNNESGEQIIKVASITLHPQYVKNPRTWDIAMIKLKQPIVYSSHVQPICLPSYDATIVVEPNTAWATGWGAIKEDGPVIEYLKQVNVPFVNANKCTYDYGDEYQPEIMICAGKPGVDTCDSDSGGPLVVQSAYGIWHQYGITSFGYGCGEVGSPGIYARMSAFCPFIANTTGNIVQCRDPRSAI